MFYGKLPIIILAEIASTDSGTTGHVLASYILDHLEEMEDITIRGLAEKTHTSIASISRFCKDIGLADFAELKSLLASTTLRFEICSEARSPARQRDDYVQAVTRSLEQVRSSIDMRKLYCLAEEIREHDKVYIFGILKGETAAMNLQTDLTMLGKKAITKLRYSQQLEELSRVTPEDLVILFSFTGIFYDYGYPRYSSPYREGRPRIYFITSDRKAKETQNFTEVIDFASDTRESSHPYQLQLIASLIAQCYAHLLENGEPEDDLGGPEEGSHEKPERSAGRATH